MLDRYELQLDELDPRFHRHDHVHIHKFPRFFSRNQSNTNEFDSDDLLNLTIELILNKVSDLSLD